LLTINKKYLLLAILLFLVEVFIALYVRDRFIRPYGGDFLVVIMLYFGVRAFSKAKPWKVAIGVLLFAILIEIGQYLHLVDRLGLSSNTLAKTVIGYGFEWWDILAYTLGVVSVFVVDTWKRGK
jgi:Protein of unknown function (DUF2809)